MKTIRNQIRRMLLLGTFMTGSTGVAIAAPAGPEPQLPQGGGLPGPFPNTSVSSVTVDARGGSTFDGNVEVAGFIAQGPIPWSVNRYNRGDIALRLSPGDASAAVGNLNQGFIDFADNSAGLAASHAWRPTPQQGVIIPTAAANGPIDWGDGEGPFFPTIALSEASSGPGYDMITGAWGTGNLDVNLGKAGPVSEANFPFSATWFPYDQGWIGGEAAGPSFEYVDLDGVPRPRWTHPNAHSAGISAGTVRWPQFPEGSFQFGGLAEVVLPGVTTADGMLFAVSSDGSSDLNILGVAPKEDGTGWWIAIREDSATDAETLVEADQSEFQFVYVPYDSENLVGGFIDGANGNELESRGDFSVNRTTAGTYELNIPGKGPEDGTLILQVADYETGTTQPLPSRAFLSYEFQESSGNFIIQSRAATSSGADLRDTSFYFAWIDFAEPLSPPPGPRLRSLGPVALTDELTTVAREAGLGINTHEPEVLVTTIDSLNSGGYIDPVTEQFAASAVVGYFVNPITLEQIGEPFPILTNPNGNFTRHDVVYNAFSRQYIVVANARSYGPNAVGIPLIAIVNPTAAGGESPVVKAFAYDEESTDTYDDVAVAASSENGNFILVAEHSFPGEGEGTVGVLFNSEGNLLTPEFSRLDTLQPTGDEDDPDVKYLDGLDVFLYTSNTDMSGGLVNRVTGSIIQTVPSSTDSLTRSAEQPLATGRLQGVTEGHPASIENPFNGEIITVFDLGGNNVSRGGISYVNVGPAPAYEFSQAREEIEYLSGTNGDPLRHNHPQIAVDPDSGVFVVGHNAYQSAVGYHNAYVFTLYGPEGEPLPSAFEAPYFLADTPGGTGGGANIHNIKYSPVSDSFIVVFNTSPGVTTVAALQLTSEHLDTTGQSPELEITQSGDDVVISWPDTAAGFVLQSADSLTNPNWAPVGTTPTSAGGRMQVTVTTDAPARFYRLARP